MDDAQDQLNTRALENAGKALTLIEAHMASCDKDRKEDRAQRAEFREEIRDGFTKTHERIDEVHSRINTDRSVRLKLVLKIAGAIILVLLAAIGTLFLRSMGWK